METVANSQPTVQPLLGVPEIAQRLGVKQHRVYDLVRQDLIPHVKLGRQLRFKAEAVEQWLDQGGRELPGGWRQQEAA